MIPAKLATFTTIGRDWTKNIRRLNIATNVCYEHPQNSSSAMLRVAKFSLKLSVDSPDGHYTNNLPPDSSIFARHLCVGTVVRFESIKLSLN
jgi:hypothetical protein